MADSITIKNTTVLKHQANVGEDVADVEFAAGTELQVLQTWTESYLVKDDDGRLFNVKKELAQES